MSKQRHKHSEPQRQARKNKDQPGSWTFHKDWRVWLAVGIMLLAISMYVLTLDDSVVPSIMRQ